MRYVSNPTIKEGGGGEGGRGRKEECKKREKNVNKCW